MNTFRVRCEHCGCLQEFDDCDVILQPFPHVECVKCGIQIPLF